MIVKKEERLRFENSPGCVAYEYPTKDKDINVAFIEINGRYPDKGYVINEAVKEIVFVLEGPGKIIIGSEEHGLEEGDVVLIPPKQKYFFDGKLKIIASCNPAWYPEQHKQFKG
jgi:mannose-6-phosphate isomerase-like protein (cupin superfamily)